MKIESLMEVKENEKPLDNIVEDGGYCSIFRTMGFIGDSLSSGEFEAIDKDGNKSYHDIFDYSWGQFIARDAGLKAYNFSRGGMTAKEFIESFADSIDAYNPSKKCIAYVLALGVNDMYVTDIGQENDYENRVDSFSRYYQEIIRKYREIEPNSKMFLLTMPKEEPDDLRSKKEKHRKLLYELAKKYKNTYVIDIFEYGPIYDKAFKEKFYLYGHLNPMGYKYTAKIVESYIDYIIRSDFKSFYQVGFIGKEQYREDIE